MGRKLRSWVNPNNRDPFVCCIACGVFLECPDPETVFQEREEWKQFLNATSAVKIKAEKLETMCFKKEPLLWMGFYQAILHKPKNDHFRISGITLYRLDLQKGASTPVPHDPEIACLACAPRNSQRYFAQFRVANVLGPDRNRDQGRQVGYPVHAHCWVLIGRIIGQRLVEVNLKTFVESLIQFWKENREWWYLVPHPIERSLDYEEGCLYDAYPRKLAPTGRNPTVVPQIEDLIQQAIARKLRSQRDEHLPQQHWRKGQNLGKQSMISQIPIDISITIIDAIGRDHSQDAENMLTAFEWRLPDAYWQSRCRRDLIFEFQDLIDTGTAVDWQFLALRAERLLRGLPELDNRARIFGLLRGLKKVFLGMLEQDKTRLDPNPNMNSIDAVG